MEVSKVGMEVLRVEKEAPKVGMEVLGEVVEVSGMVWVLDGQQKEIPLGQPAQRGTLLDVESFGFDESFSLAGRGLVH